MSVILECKSLTKRYSGFTALSDINLSLERGRIIGLLGPNGSGKTTLIKIINGLLVPTEGKILIADRAPGIETKKIISYLPDKNYLSDWMKVHDLIDFFADFYEDFDKTKAYEMLSRLKINANDRLKTMSKGTKEKVQLILVMSRSAQLYCLDEPIGGVDPASRDYILNTIISNYSENASVLISTHLIADIENVLDDVIFLQNGNIVRTSSVDDIRMSEGKSVDTLFREVFKC
jgi:ABC-type multidrug transport system, ATPase component